jgi:hypothetical protein
LDAVLDTGTGGAFFEDGVAVLAVAAALAGVLAAGLAATLDLPAATRLSTGDTDFGDF